MYIAIRRTSDASDKDYLKIQACDQGELDQLCEYIIDSLRLTIDAKKRISSIALKFNPLLSRQISIFNKNRNTVAVAPSSDNKENAPHRMTLAPGQIAVFEMTRVD
jgi:hypothetical protein